jgi:hypothetical protein
MTVPAPFPREAFFMPRILFFACLLLACTLSAAGCKSVTSDQGSSGKPMIPLEEKDALYLVQGHSKNGHVDHKLKRQVLQALKTIRANYPELSQIHVFERHTLDNMIVYLDKNREATVVRYMKRDDKNLPYLVRHSGLASLDRLVRRYRGRYCKTGLEDTSILSVLFPRPMDMRSLQREFDALPGIASSPNMSLGGGDDIIFKPRGDKWHFIFKRGWEHSLGYPLKQHYHYYTYEPDSGRVVKKAQLPPEMRFSGIIHLWGVPGRRSVRPFVSLQDLRAKAAHKNWWVRLHAVDVLGFLLTNPAHSRLGEDDQPKGHFKKLRDEVRSNHQRALGSLRKASFDTDREVRQTASRAFKKIMATRYPRAKIGLRAKVLDVRCPPIIGVSCGVVAGVRDGDVFEIRREGKQLGRARASAVWADFAVLRPLDSMDWKRGDDAVLVKLAPVAAGGKEAE